MLRTLLLIAWIPFILPRELGRQEDDERHFQDDRIDVGIVVSDIDASASFYSEALGLAEEGSFDVPAQLCDSVGLTDDQPLAIRVFTTDTINDDATRVKLMQISEVESKPSDNTYIHSQLGISYLTVGVRDIDAAMKRIRAAGGEALGQGPVRLGERPGSDYLALVRDPDGNIIELVGTKR